MPGGPGCLARHAHLAGGRWPLVGSDTDRVGRHHHRRAVPFEMKEPHGGQVDHNPFSGSVRQDETQGQNDALSCLGHPYIHPRIRRTDCIDPQTEVPRDIRQRIPLFKPDDRQPADDVFSFCNRKIIPAVT